MIGPAPCPIERVKNRWRWHLLIKSTNPALLTRACRFLVERLEVPKNRSQLRVALDRDPVSLPMTVNSSARHSNSDAEFAGALGARNAEGRRKLHHTVGAGRISRGREERGNDLGRANASPRGRSPSPRLWRTAGVPSGRVLRPSALRPRSGRLRILRRCWTIERTVARTPPVTSCPRSAVSSPL